MCMFRVFSKVKKFLSYLSSKNSNSADINIPSFPSRFLRKNSKTKKEKNY